MLPIIIFKHPVFDDNNEKNHKAYKETGSMAHWKGQNYLTETLWEIPDIVFTRKRVK